MNALSSAAIQTRRVIAARRDLTRGEQAALLGIDRSTWIQEIVRRGFAKRTKGRGIASALALRQGGLVYTVTRDSKTRLVLILRQPAVDALGAKAGTRVRVRAYGKRIVITRERG